MIRQWLNQAALVFVALVLVSPAILFFIWMISLSLKMEIDNSSPHRWSWSAA